MNDKETIEYLVNENIGLVNYCYSKIADCKAKFFYKNDLLSEGYYTLYLAASQFDSSLGYKFSSYAYTSIFNRMLNCLDKLSPIFRQTASLDKTFGSDSDEDNSFIEDLSLASSLKEDRDTDICEELILKENVKETINEIKEMYKNKPKYLKAIDLFLQDYNYTEIGKELNTSRQDISILFQNIKKKYNKKHKE